MKIISTKQILLLEKPLGEPEIAAKWNDEKYYIERSVNSKYEIIWYGQSTNWIKGLNENWKKLIDGDFVECEEPLYEKLYLKLLKEKL